jgi:hypothetical protein
MGSTCGYADYEDDMSSTVLFESAQFIKANKIYELDVSLSFCLNTYSFDDEARDELITNLVDLAIKESTDRYAAPRPLLNLWIYLMIEMRGYGDLFRDRVYTDFARDYVIRYGVPQTNHFFNQPIVVMGRNVANKNNDPHQVSIDNFAFGKVSIHFQNESIKDIEFGTDRPMNIIDPSQQDPEFQRRHMISVLWFKQSILRTFKGRYLEDCTKDIQFAREDLLQKLKIQSWPRYPIESRMNRENFENSLAAYDAEFSVILKKAESIKLNPRSFIYLFCSAFDNDRYNPYVEDFSTERHRIFARGVAELYRNMVHCSYYQFVGPKQENQTLGFLTYRLKPFIEKWRGNPEYPIRINLSAPDNKQLRDFFFGKNDTSVEGRTLVIDTPKMLMDLYFNAQYDYQTIGEPSLTNHMKLFKHTYGEVEPDTQVAQPANKKVKLN